MSGGSTRPRNIAPNKTQPEIPNALAGPLGIRFAQGWRFLGDLPGVQLLRSRIFDRTNDRTNIHASHRKLDDCCRALAHLALDAEASAVQPHDLIDQG